MSALHRYPITVADVALAAKCAYGRVIIIDDDPEILSALAALIELEGYACETYPSALVYLQVLAEQRHYFAGPICLLCDVKMPELDGLALQKRLKQLDDTPLLLMSGASGALEAASAFRAGALDFLIKPIDADELLTAISKALLISAGCQAQSVRASNLATRIASLTAREREVAQHVARGLTNPAIAIKLGLALRTVKLYRQNATQKLGTSSTAELVRIADEGGL